MKKVFLPNYSNRTSKQPSLVDRCNSTTPQPFILKDGRLETSALRTRSVEIHSNLAITPHRLPSFAHSPESSSAVCVPNLPSGIRRFRRSLSVCNNTESVFRKTSTVVDRDGLNHDNPEGSRRLALTSPRRGSSLRVASVGVPPFRRSVGIAQQSTPSRRLRSGVNRTLLDETANRGYSSSQPEPVGVANSGPAHLMVSKLRQGTTPNMDRHLNTAMPHSTSRSVPKSQSLLHSSSSHHKRVHKEHVGVFPQTFERIVLDPGRFNSEKVRRDAALVILRCLHIKKYNHQISIQDLVHCPSTQLYINLMQFLFTQILPSNEPFVLEETVTNMFKLLGYPLPFAKSHFRSPCTPLMWPHHLASIAWLCALLIFDETVLLELAGPLMLQSPRGETLPAITDTPKVIGGFRCQSDETKSGRDYHEWDLKLDVMKSPYQSSSSLRQENEIFPVDVVVNEPITVALIRTIQNAYLLHKQKGKKVDEKDLGRLLDADLAEYRQREQAVLQEVLAMRDAAKEAYMIEKAKVDEIGMLQCQASQQAVDVSRFESRIQTTEKLIEDKTRRIENLKAESATQALRILELKQQIKEVSGHVKEQGISKDEVEDCLKKTRYKKKVLEDIQKDTANASRECCSLEKRAEQMTKHVEESLATCAQLLENLCNTPIYTIDNLPRVALRIYPVPLCFSRTSLNDEKLEQLASAFSYNDIVQAKQHQKRSICYEYTEDDVCRSYRKSLDSPWANSSGTVNESLSNAIEELFQDSFYNVSWKEWSRQLETTIENQKSLLNDIKKKIKSTEQITSTLESAMQLKTKKIDSTQSEIIKLNGDLKIKNIKYDAQLNELQEVLKRSRKTFITQELEELKRTGVELQNALAEAHTKKQCATKHLEETERKVMGHVFTWINTAKQEISIVLSKLNRTKSVILRENKNIEALYSAMSKLENECTSLVSCDDEDIFVRLRNATSPPLASHAEGTRLPRLLGSPTLSRVVYLTPNTSLVMTGVMRNALENNVGSLHG